MPFSLFYKLTLYALKKFCVTKEFMLYSEEAVWTEQVEFLSKVSIRI